MQICNNIDINGKRHLTFAGKDTLELAKKYGTDNSSSYINGVLSNFVKSI